MMFALVVLAVLLSAAWAQQNTDIVDVCEQEQWTTCNKNYQKCQMKVNASPCPCFRTLLECGAATGCISELERATTITACQTLCAADDCSSAASLVASVLALAAAAALAL